MAYFSLVYDAKLSPESIGLDADFIESLKRKDDLKDYLDCLPYGMSKSRFQWTSSSELVSTTST
jgi:hypothetical protein